ncbi:MAG: glycosyltransferase, partial [Candidatus Chisholmbacteria bacterium]|nr:glycosyltransferase [Candidatus Chisholmbacteria bacterium]
MKDTSISIIIPARNEEKALAVLVQRIHAAVFYKMSYEIIYVDDRSSDGSLRLMERLAKYYPIRIHEKRGKRGKAYSILEGAQLARNEWLVMIDADLQYPPEAIPAMVEKMEKHGVVVANRKQYKGSLVRRLLSRANSLVFGKVLFGLSCDIQSGLKLFRKDILEHVDSSLVRAWALDLPLLSAAREIGYSIGSVDISFEIRKNGASKINLTKTAWEIATGAVATWLNVKPVYTLRPSHESSMIGAGVAHRRKRFITHSTLPHQVSAMVTFTFWQQVALVAMVTVVALGLALNTAQTAIVVVAILSAIYFFDVLFNLFLVLRSLHRPPDIRVSDEELENIDNSILPFYSILCPLYREPHVVGQFLQAIAHLDWPKSRLDVMLLLEQDDTETIEKVQKLDIPSYVRVLVVPDSAPKTKPKACNWGLAHAKGEYVVIYDAEDIPDPKQLKTAYLAFAKAPAKTVCLQAKLNFYNPHHNLLTRLFTAEYSLWFDVVLTGLQSIETSIPLGGTSNHFKAEILKKLHGWDAFNVTEDCDLGARLFTAGYKTAVIDSVTLEEANSKFINWLRQRSRWIKGYIQTYLVHMRNPIRFTAKHREHSLFFQLVVGGKIAFMFINPFLWLATISYFTLYALVGPTIESLYPTIVFYMAVTSLVFGNFLFIYYYMIGAARHGHWDIIKYVYLVPFYWLMVSTGAVIALVQLIVKPHYWEKTHHGFHL